MMRPTARKPSVAAEVVFRQLKNCLVNLPPSLVSALVNADAAAQNVVVELQFRSQTLSGGAVSSGNSAGFQKSAYMGWTGMPSEKRTPSAPTAGRDQELAQVEIDSTFAKVLGLTEGLRVGVYLHLDPPIAHTINIEPLTPADWEVIELHANFLELNLLSQIRALPNPSCEASPSVQAGHMHPLTLHLSPTSTANIIITSLVPSIPSTSPFAKIAPDAEVVVAPKVRPKSSRSMKGDATSVASRRSGKSGMSSGRNRSSKTDTRPKALFARALDRSTAQSWFDSKEGADENNGLKVWVHRDIQMSRMFAGHEYVSVSLLKPAGIRAQLEQTQIQRLKDEESSTAGLAAQKIVAKLCSWSTPPESKHIAISSLLANMLGIVGVVGLLLRVEPAPPMTSRSIIKALKLYPFTADSTKKSEGLKFGGDTKAARDSIAEKFRTLHTGKDGLLSGPLTDGMVLPVTDIFGGTAYPGGVLRFEMPSTQPTDRAKSLFWIVGDDLRVGLQSQPVTPRPLEVLTLFPTFDHGVPDVHQRLIGVGDLNEKCMSNLSLCSSVLLTGVVGSGKTVLAQSLCQQLREEYLIHASYFSCRKLVTDETRVSTIRETLTRLFMTAAWCARLGGQSIVVLDDLDKICPVETELQTADNGRSKQVTENLCSIVRKYCSVESGVALLATAQSKNALHNIIISSHIVGDIIDLKAPDKEKRRRLLEMIVHGDSSSERIQRQINGHSRHQSGSNGITDGSWMDPSNPPSRPDSSHCITPPDGFQVSPSLDLLDLAGRTDGYMPADLHLLVSRARSESLIRTFASSSNSPILSLTKDDFDSALKNFIPTSLRNVTLTKSTQKFTSVGGLQETRKILLETLLYPTKYAPIFAASPLRLRSGLLLYGYPGCGKTLLASAISAEAGNLNFISVKGPEILNKYIGASEKSVRDLFERAQAAKPCVLFFDEFDSIAPKRGHDSTGVTDRVVNQMLTQMDGAEGLDGVYVLAATSRPDLIDPALLRPGRLDKSLLCDMPSLEDRIDILRAVSSKLKLRDEVRSNFAQIAEKANGFSGADLQALMYNAHLDAIHDLLGDTTSTGLNLKTQTDGKVNGAGNLHNKRRSTKAEPKAKYDFSQFLMGADQDEEFTKTLQSSSALAASRNEIVMKLDSLKLAKKRERVLRHGQPPPTSLEGKQSHETSNENKDNEVWIATKHIEQALKTTRASISPQERGRLKAIYDEFVQGRNGEMPNGEGTKEIGGRTSLM